MAKTAVALAIFISAGAVAEAQMMPVDLGGESEDDHVDIQVIERDAPMLGTDSAGPTVVALNRHSFAGNVHNVWRNTKWIVKYCHKWFEPCAVVDPIYRSVAGTWERQLNPSTVLEPAVRFAEVDCSVDKNLCNVNGVHQFPSVVAYHKGQPVNVFVARIGADLVEKETKRLQRWLERTLQPEDASSLPQRPTEESEEPSALGMAAIIVLGTALILGGNYALLEYGERRENVQGYAAPKNDNPSAVQATPASKQGQGQGQGPANCTPEAGIRVRVALRAEDFNLEL